ncbi:MAG: hypothetical protein HY828_17715 [Actinobacteria bacterium]|nr:hypothetical protein [Actinomycetota bacterium]
MDVRWDAPGPGQWAVDRSHIPSGATPLVQDLVSRSMPAGMRRVFAELGAPIDTLDVRFVNGQFYSRIRPLLGADRTPTRLPPAFVLKAVMRLHPEMRRRNRAAGAVLVDEPWKRVIHDWQHGEKQRIAAENLAIQSVPLGELADEDLVAHVHRCIAHCSTNWELHFWLHGYDVGPIGRLLYEARDWGVPAAVLLSLLEGASPSTTEPAIALARIREAVEASGRTPHTLDDIRAVSPEVDAMVTEYLDRRGAVLFSRYDIDGVTLAERPDLVVASIMNAEVRDNAAAVAARIADARHTVPAPHRAQFDELLAQARDAMDLRDDNGPITAEWPLGLMRLAVLELGRRMVRRGVVGDHLLALEIEPTEVDTVLSGRPSGDVLQARAERRQALKRVLTPSLLGPPEPTPPPDVLPADMARLTGMVQIVMQHMGMDGEARSSGMAGVGIGGGAITGRARVATSPEEALDLLEPGDILVVAGTTPAYNLVLSIAGGVVTAEGGSMSHAAVIARELGIPAVVGARAALTDIPDGAMVRLDADAGVIELLNG